MDSDELQLPSTSAADYYDSDEESVYSWQSDETGELLNDFRQVKKTETNNLKIENLIQPGWLILVMTGFLLKLNMTLQNLKWLQRLRKSLSSAPRALLQISV